MKNNDIHHFFFQRFLQLKWSELGKITDQWGFIRQAYMEALPGILASAQEDHRRWYRPYALDWDRFMNKYEKMAWSAIRGRGNVVLYPQFPAFNFFIDFANPFLRIGLEIDGKKHDRDKDAARDKLLAQIGWKIFRVPACEAHTKCKDLAQLTESGIEGDERMQAVRHWLMHSLDGVVQAIEWVYFAPQNSGDDMPTECREILVCAKESLMAHRLVEFPLRR